MKLKPKDVQKDLKALPEGFKTKDVDRLIAGYVRNKADVSELRGYVLSDFAVHRIYFYVSLKQMKTADERADFIDKNLLFEDWRHTDELIGFVSGLDFKTALGFAKRYVNSEMPFVRRWGYVMFISKLCVGHAKELLPLMHNDEHYYVQMGEAWLIAELAVSDPSAVYDWLSQSDLSYRISGKAIQKICDSFRISDEQKEKFKSLRAKLNP